MPYTFPMIDWDTDRDWERDIRTSAQQTKAHARRIAAYGPPRTPRGAAFDALASARFFRWVHNYAAARSLILRARLIRTERLP